MHSSTTAPENSTQPERGRLRHWTEVVVNGAHPWGVLRVGLVDRTGHAVRYQLVIFPPGISDAERRALVLLRRWPGIGSALAILVCALLGTVMGGWAALGVGAVVFLAGFLVLRVSAGDARRRTVRLMATVVKTLGYREVLGDLNAIEDAAGILLQLDERRDAGLLSAAQYEHIWGLVYREAAEMSDVAERQWRGSARIR